MNSQNAMMVIFPYKKNGVWMFDDAAVGSEARAVRVRRNLR